MKLALVVQRYGVEVNGGAERHARQVAEHLAPYFNIEVLTSCARDYTSWENYYPAGCEHINSVAVRRFPVRTTRNLPAFNTLSQAILRRGGQRELAQEVEWVQAQGPDTPALQEYIREHHYEYDLFLFFTYLYSTTVLGLPLVAYKSILCPTAHDEPWLRFDLYRSLFAIPRGLIFLSLEEEQMVRQRFRNDYIPGDVIGGGIEAPPVPAEPPIPEDYLLYLGRVDLSKGCGDLVQGFLRYKAETHDRVKLVLVGQVVTELPAHPDILVIGFVSDTERSAWLGHATVLVMPSQHESFSLATLEAWSVGVPALVNGRSEVLKGHCLRSNAGLYYENPREFVEALRLLRSNPELRRQMGQQGRAYVAENYDWHSITERHVRFICRIYDVVYRPT